VEADLDPRPFELNRFVLLLEVPEHKARGGGQRGLQVRIQPRFDVAERCGRGSRRGVSDDDLRDRAVGRHLCHQGAAERRRGRLKCFLAGRVRDDHEVAIALKHQLVAVDRMTFAERRVAFLGAARRQVDATSRGGVAHAIDFNHDLRPGRGGPVALHEQVIESNLQKHFGAAVNASVEIGLGE